MSASEAILRYERGALLGDYARAIFGLLLTGAPLLAVEASSVMTVILGAMAALFAAFGLKTLLRQRTRVMLDDDGVGVQALGLRRLAWAELNGLKLSYYTTRRDRQSGWMQLTLGGPGGRLRFDSALQHFPALVARALEAALARELALSASTRANLAAMNIAIPGVEN